MRDVWVEEVFPPSTGNQQTDLRLLVEFLTPTRYLIEDTGAADSEHTIPHGRSSVPRRVDIARQQVPDTTADAVGWYHEADDTDWDEENIYIRFNVANCKVMLEIF